MKNNEKMEKASGWKTCTADRRRENMGMNNEKTIETGSEKKKTKEKEKKNY